MLFKSRFAKLFEAESDDEWTQWLFEYACQIGFEFCLFGYVPDKKFPLEGAWVRSSFPSEWLERYFGRGYTVLDTKVSYCMSHTSAFLWIPESFKGVNQKKIYEEGCEFGLRAGISLPIHGPQNTYGQLCLAKNVDPKIEFRQFVEEKFPDILIFREVVSFTASRFTRSALNDRMGDLSDREIQCLMHAARGRTSRHIGELLDCTESNVNFHITNARKKLRAPNRQAAIAIAIQHGKLIL